MITAVISIYNEEKTIKDIIRSVKKHSDEILVVVAKGSTDRSLDIAKSMGARTLIDNGKGKGAAIRLGIQEAKGDIIVFIDADGSHTADDIPMLVAPIQSKKSDLVVASRMLGGSEELHGTLSEFVRMLFSSIITLIINYRFSIHTTDSQNGFRAIRKSVAKELELKANIFDIETEMVMKTAKKGYKISEVPSRELKRIYGKSRINVMKMGPVYFWRVISNLF